MKLAACLLLFLAVNKITCSDTYETFDPEHHHEFYLTGKPLELNITNFKEKMEEYTYSLVLYHKQEVEDYKAAQELLLAAMLLKYIDFDHVKVSLGKVNCTNDPTLCAKIQVLTVPILKFYQKTSFLQDCKIIWF